MDISSHAVYATTSNNCIRPLGVLGTKSVWSTWFSHVSEESTMISSLRYKQGISYGPRYIMESGFFFEKEGVMPAKVIEFNTLGKTPIHRHGTERRGGLRQVVIPDVIAKGTQLLRRQRPPHGAHPCAITIQIDRQIFIFLAHGIYY